MNELDFLHFEQLKNEIQTQYLKNHTPSQEDISKWKGIDIIYFQEDLRKLAKGNISEKTFYTYFKSLPVTKLPRIDMLNLLSVYAGYVSWFDFKKKHLFANEILQELEELTEADDEELEKEIEALPETDKTSQIEKNTSILTEEKVVLQKNISDNKDVSDFSKINSDSDFPNAQKPKNFVKQYLWLGISAILAIAVGLLGFKDELFSKKYTYSFVDADRNSKINTELQVKIMKKGESPIIYIAKPGEKFVYTTKSNSLKMLVSSPYYKTQEITRNLDTAPEEEKIELIPNDYAIMLFYYSKSLTDLKKKRASLNYLISDNALIYQVYDNEKYGVETMDKQRYISLTLTNKSLENLEVIDTKTNDNGKINMIKFRILSDENKNP